MDVSIINPFLTACENAFVNMFNVVPQHKDPYIVDVTMGHRWEVSGLLGVTGDYTGVVAFRLHKTLAAKMLALSGVEVSTNEEKDEMARQLVSEFTNIIAGNAISVIKGKNITVSVPVTVAGENHIISWPRSYPVIGVPFITSSGPFEVDVCFKQ
ncbi:MAG: chemotaxis protein CheX [Treponema sp.]|nr:chemotaxis protein CheX [Treponema sp.]